MVGFWDKSAHAHKASCSVFQERTATSLALWVWCTSSATWLDSRTSLRMRIKHLFYFRKELRQVWDCGARVGTHGWILGKSAHAHKPSCSVFQERTVTSLALWCTNWAIWLDPRTSLLLRMRIKHPVLYFRKELRQVWHGSARARQRGWPPRTCLRMRINHPVLYFREELRKVWYCGAQAGPRGGILGHVCACA